MHHTAELYVVIKMGNRYQKKESKKKIKDKPENIGRAKVQD